MGRKSSIEQLDPRIKEAVDRLVREGRATIDDIVEAIDALGGEASRSAVGRYVRNARAQMDRYRQAQEVAKVWVGKLEENPEGDVGRLLSEMLRTIAFQTMAGMGEDEELAPNPGEIMFLAKAIKELASADKLSADRALKIREQALRQAASQAEKIVRSKGMSAEAASEIRREILGVKA